VGLANPIVVERLVVKVMQKAERRFAAHAPKPQGATASAVAVSEWMQRFVITVNMPCAIVAG